MVSRRLALGRPSGCSPCGYAPPGPTCPIPHEGPEALPCPGGLATVGSALSVEPPPRHTGAQYSYKTDVWSLGVILYKMASNRYPFDANNLAQLALKITAGSFPPLSPKYSPLLHHLVASMLQIEADNRSDTADVVHASIVTEHRDRKSVV